MSQRRDHGAHLITEETGAPDCSHDPPAEDQAYGINALADSSAPIAVDVDLNGAQVTMQVDTGASRSIISKAMFTSLWTSPPRLEPLSRPLRTYTGERVPVVGVASAKVDYQGQKATLPLIVADTTGPPLLGREWLRELRLDWKSLFNLDPLHSVSSPPAPEARELEAALQRDRAEFSDLFELGMGRYNVRKVSIEIDPAVKPIFLKHRPPLLRSERK